MSEFQIRMAEESDNDRILGLAEKCPQEGMITFFVNRTPRFNSLHRLLDPESFHFLALKDDQVIGLVGVIYFKGNVLGIACKIGFMLDLRVEEAYRSGTLAYRLVKTAVDYLYQSDVDMVIANFITNNQRSLVFTKGRGKLPVAYYLGRNRNFNLIPMFPMKPDMRFEIGTPREGEIPEIVELYHKYSLNFKISPIISEEWFRDIITRIDGLSLQRFLVARENGKIKAMTAMWDEHIYKSYQVLKLTRNISLVNNLIRFLSLFMQVPHPIKLNEPLRQLSLVFYAHDDCPEALVSLFKQVNNLNIGADYTLIMLYGQENDPMFELMKKFKGVSVNSEMYIFSKDTSVFEKFSKDPSPVLFDISMTL
jgi:N-acetylglutamate synthase-like GNAT family acetyltransferase